MTESWADITGFEGLYQVSNTGLVRSKHKTLTNNRNKNGYESIYLCNNGFRKRVYIHRIVATAFIPNPHSKPEVNHIDGSKHNNSANNLEWCTSVENKAHAIMTGLKKPLSAEARERIASSKRGVKRSAVCIRRFSEMQKQLYANGKISPRSQTVIDMETGIFFDSIQKAKHALSINTPYQTVVDRVKYDCKFRLKRA